MDYGGYDPHSSGGVEVGPKLYMNLMTPVLGQVGFGGWRCWKGPSASAIFTTGGRRVVDEGKWICARPLSFSETQRGSFGTARAPGLASTSIITRLGLSWNAGDLVEESSAHRC